MMCDCETPYCSTISFPKARKSHECCECHRVIQSGEKYELYSGVWEGRGHSYKTCGACSMVRNVYLDGLTHGDCGPVFGGLWEACRETGESDDFWLKQIGDGGGSGMTLTVIDIFAGIGGFRVRRRKLPAWIFGLLYLPKNRKG